MGLRVAFLLLAIVAAPARAGEPAQPSRQVDGGTASFSIVDQADGTHWWRRSNKSFRIETVQLDPAGDLSHYLFLTEQMIDTHIGIEGSKSRLKVTAYPLTETNVGRPAWSFEAEGDAWELVGNRIEVTKFGCCDAPGKTFYFAVRDGRPTD